MLSFLLRPPRSYDTLAHPFWFCQVTYLPVPYLPSGSTFVKDFLLSLFPPAAVQNGEIEILTVPEEALIDAGLVAAKGERDDGEEEGEWEWKEGHSTFACVFPLH